MVIPPEIIEGGANRCSDKGGTRKATVISTPNHGNLPRRITLGAWIRDFLHKSQIPRVSISASSASHLWFFAFGKPHRIPSKCQQNKFQYVCHWLVARSLPLSILLDLWPRRKSRRAPAWLRDYGRRAQTFSLKVSRFKNQTNQSLFHFWQLSILDNLPPLSRDEVSFSTIYEIPWVKLELYDFIKNLS